MSRVLYTPEMLRAALDLANFPPLGHADVHHEQRATPCGSRIVLDLNVDADGKISAIGLRVSACAVGQTAAAACARGSVGKTLAEFNKICADISAWLVNDAAPLPDWPGLMVIAPARYYPARHGAILLAFTAVRDTLVAHANVTHAKNLAAHMAVSA